MDLNLHEAFTRVNLKTSALEKNLRINKEETISTKTLKVIVASIFTYLVMFGVYVTSSIHALSTTQSTHISTAAVIHEYTINKIDAVEKELIILKNKK